VANSDVREAGLVEVGEKLARPVETHVAAGDAEIRSSIRQREPTVDRQDTRDLRERSRWIRVVVEGGGTQDGGEGSVRERQPFAVADDELRLRGPGGERLRAFGHAGRDVESDGSLDDRRGWANGPGCSAAHVEEPIARQQSQRVKGFLLRPRVEKRDRRSCSWLPAQRSNFLLAAAFACSTR
jgi:hypothetical protein